MPTDALTAIDPRTNAVVHAAAGTGKTWLLVSRLLRLLLQGAVPSSILAITFTRKAAAEMRVRLNQRLLAMCEASDAELRTMLQTIGVAPTADMQQRARRLYEELLVTPHELRVTTFHAFCQELLARFSFEAGIAPASEVVEFTTEIETAAWRALDRDLIEDEGVLAAAMERLLRSAGGLDYTRQALWEFLNHRSDWWAYTEELRDPPAEAARRLQQALAVDPQHPPLDAFARDPIARAALQSLVAGLGGDTPDSLKPMLARLQNALAADSGADFYRLVYEALYTQDGKKPREFKITKTLAKLLGPAASDTLLQHHRTLLERLEQASEHYQRYAAWERHRDWYTLGARLLQHFQEQKRIAGVLDFADLEWLAYRLLSRSRHAEWVQYKLDQRLDHLLVDEFQDTNPTQWRLLLPLLQEIAAGSAERLRSLFLVGDEKQSIYRFRRADPALFTLARDWLTAHSNAQVHEQHISWRSSPAVVRFVNLLFDVPASDDGDAARRLDYRLPHFRPHDTHRKDLWGHAELLPLILRDTAAPAVMPFRNPLERPRVVDDDQRRRREGDMVAQKILSLLGQPIRDGEVRRLCYGDIMILVRNRTYAPMYEAALRAAGIPYSGAGRGNFLDCLEVRDIVDLLRLLVSPFENVALVAVLRSPMFDATHDDLLALAASEVSRSWYARLMHGYRADTAIAPLARAARLLHDWRNLADRIPVHDLLDRIYFDADVPERYAAAAPTHLRARVGANLTRLLDLALDADGGRFPSLARFLSRLEVLTEEENESLGAGAAAMDQVRLLTIHGAKGLESPVVFLVDAARDLNAAAPGPEVLVDWPIEQPRPANFLLLGRSSELDARSREIAERQAQAAFQEETNLLYVALTRAQQYLFVSGCESGRRKGNGPGRAGDEGRGWYGYIEQRFAQASSDAEKFGLHLQPIPPTAGSELINLTGSVMHGVPPAIAISPAPSPIAISVDAALTRPFHPRPTASLQQNPEETEEELTIGEDIQQLSAAKQRGVVIHRMLERLTSDPDRMRARRLIEQEFGTLLGGEQLEACWTEACGVLEAADFAQFFDARFYAEARNEVVVVYESGGNPITGIIDRLLIMQDKLVLIDYKTNRVRREELATLASAYTGQLRRYAEGLGRLWPGRRVEAVLLFTAVCTSIPVDTTLSPPGGK